MCLSILACLFPPLAVCFRTGCGLEFCVSILLTIMGWIPGMCYACCIIHREQQAGVNVKTTTNVVVAAPAPAPPSHVTVNVPTHYHSPPYPNQYPNHPQPGFPMQQVSSPPAPGFHAPPPPMYSSAPPYYGEGEK